MILADIGLETSIVVLLMFFITIDTSSDSIGSRIFSLTTYGVLFTPIFVLILIAAARAPFDLPEAESELVSGPLTDVGGSAFSFCLLLDYMEMLT
jgi:NADH-quinone oxidoreductase subunit H